MGHCQRKENTSAHPHTMKNGYGELDVTLTHDTHNDEGGARFTASQTAHTLKHFLITWNALYICNSCCFCLTN